MARSKSKAFVSVFAVDPPLEKNDQSQLHKIEDDLRQMWSKRVDAAKVHPTLSRTVQLLKEYRLLLRSIETTPAQQQAQWDYVLTCVTGHGSTYLFALKRLIAGAGRRALGEGEAHSNASDVWQGSDATVQQDLFEMLNDLEDVGLGDSLIDTAWSAAVDVLLDEFVDMYSALEHDGLPHVALEDFVGQCFVFSIARFDQSSGKPIVWRQEPLVGTRFEQWAAGENKALTMVKVRGMEKMGSATAKKLCNDIVRGDMLNKEPGDASSVLQAQFAAPGLRDKNAQRLLQVFKSDILHSGNSTTFVLQKFVSAVRILHRLGASSVFVDKFARPIQEYLRSREDAVRIVILSLLEDTRDDQGKVRSDSDMFCGAIAACMSDRGALDWQKYYDGMDLQDMNWQPEPLEAGPGYLSTKVSDTISYLINISPQTAFVTQLKAVLAARLLQRTTSGQTTFTNEIALLNLFKQRFGEIDIQACEIMIRDVLSSQQLNANIENYANSRGQSTPQLNPNYGTIVVSQHYWSLPQQNSDLAIPPSIEQSHKAFNDAFASIKQMRKVQYLNELGKVKVSLQLDDRTIETECTPAQATMIHSIGEDSGRSWSLSELMQKTKISEPLARQCLAYWQVSRVIEKIAQDGGTDTEATYAVLERLPTDATGTKESAPPPMSPADHSGMAAPPIKRPEDILNENKELYSRFIVGMLTNQGAMDEKRIHLMLKVALPGGFPFELALMKRYLLGVMEREGVVEVMDGVHWRIRRVE